MALNDFIKSIDAELDTQEENFCEKLLLRAAEVGIDIAEVTEAINIITTHRNLFSMAIQKKAEAKAAVAANKKGEKDAVKEFRRIAKKIKYSKGYTVALGKELGIVGPEIHIPSSGELRPTLKVTVSAIGVQIKFNKGEMDGVKIYSKRANETRFEFLDSDTISPYIDKRPKLAAGPEERQYYAFYIFKDEATGQQSNIVTAIVP